MTKRWCDLKSSWLFVMKPYSHKRACRRNSQRAPRHWETISETEGWISDCFKWSSDQIGVTESIVYKTVTVGKAPLPKQRTIASRLTHTRQVPGHPLIRSLADIAVDPRITAHSIVLSEGPLTSRTDGVVSYESAHIDGVASELVVR